MKIFCVGYNKTGTTSLSEIFHKNNFLVAPQKPFECNMESYFFDSYDTIVKMIKNDYFQYSFFQDLPFSLPNLYKTLYENFPDAKFILTVRDNEDIWYNSIVRFHKKIFSNFRNPSEISWTYKGLIFKKLTQVYGAPKYSPYDYDSLTKSYLKHIEDVENFFKHKKNSLIKINLKDPDLIDNLEAFLDINLQNRDVPHLNKFE
jgi:hypothetical protein